MTEFAQGHEAHTPHDAAIDGFFNLLKRNAASETQLKMALAELLGATTGNGINHSVYLHNWSERHSYDVHGIVVDNQGYIEEGDSSDAETPEVLDKKLALLGEVSAFLIASHHSLLNESQKETLMYRVGAFFDARDRHYELADRFGAAVAPYMAHDIDMIEMAGEQGDYESADRAVRIRRGRFVLRTVDRPPYMHAQVGRVMSRGLRRARRN